MHNLFLGTCKHMMEVWKDRGILNQAKLSQIQTKGNNLVVPHQIGRIPIKIEAHFSGFTAAEWKNWALVYSVFCLQDILPHADLNIWKMFVRACYILCQHTVSKDQVEKAHKLLIEFNKGVETAYGWQACTMNMHLHCHLQQSILDFGPIYSFWCFPYERLNGVLGSYSTSRHSIVIQIMRKFSSNSAFSEETLPLELDESVLEDVRSTLQTIMNESPPSNVRLSMSPASNPVVMKEMIFGDPRNSKFYDSSFHLHKPICESFFITDEIESVSSMYHALYGSLSNIKIPRLYYQSTDASNDFNHFTSEKSLTQKSPYVYANWYVNSSMDDLGLLFGKVVRFLEHTITLMTESQVYEQHKYVLANVLWHIPLCTLPAQVQPHDPYFHVWENSLSNSVCNNSFIPISRIMCPGAITTSSYRLAGLSQDAIVSVPVNRPIQ